MRRANEVEYGKKMRELLPQLGYSKFEVRKSSLLRPTRFEVAIRAIYLNRPGYVGTRPSERLRALTEKKPIRISTDYGMQQLASDLKEQIAVASKEILIRDKRRVEVVPAKWNKSTHTFGELKVTFPTDENAVARALFQRAQKQPKSVNASPK